MPAAPKELTLLLAETTKKLLLERGMSWESDAEGSVYAKAGWTLNLDASTASQRLLALEQLGLAKIERTQKGEGHLKVLSIAFSDNALERATGVEAAYRAERREKAAKSASKRGRNLNARPAAARVRTHVLRGSTEWFRQQGHFQLQ